MRARSVAGCVMALSAIAGAAGCTAQQVGQGAHKAAESASMIMQRVAHTTDAKRSAQIDVSVDMAGQTVHMAGTYAWGPGAGMDVRMDSDKLGMKDLTSAATVEMRYVGGAYYYGVDPQPDGPLKGKHWLKVDAKAVLGDSAGRADDGLQQNPTSGLDGLSASDDVHKVGSETLNGKPATHYTGSFSKADLAKHSKVFSEAQKGAMGKLFGDSDTMTLDVWVDGQNLPVRMVEGIGSTKITMDFKSFGGVQHIQVPPATDTADLSAAVEQGLEKSA